jgi:hypothetical protein
MSDLVKYENDTAEYIGASEQDWGHEPINHTIAEVAKALNATTNKAERKEILDVQLKNTIDAYMTLTTTLSHLMCFLGLAYKVEGLFWLDLEGMENEFHSPDEAFEYWAREHLRKLMPPGRDSSNIRMKVRYYLNANNDMKMIEQLTFHRAWVISKWKPRFEALGMKIPDDVMEMAEGNVDVTELSRALEWAVVEREKSISFKRAHQDDPSDKQVKLWKSHWEQEKLEYSLARTQASPPGSESYKKLHAELGGLVKGDHGGLMVFLRSMLDVVAKDFDPGNMIFEFIHSGHYEFCMISNQMFGPANPLEIHHLISRGAAGDRRFMNLVPICRKVHQEVGTLGLNLVLKKYAVTEEFIIGQGVLVLTEYIKWLEKYRADEGNLEEDA